MTGEPRGQSSCVLFPSTGVTGVHHHAWICTYGFWESCSSIYRDCKASISLTGQSLAAHVSERIPLLVVSLFIEGQSPCTVESPAINSSQPPDPGICTRKANPCRTREYSLPGLSSLFQTWSLVVSLALFQLEPPPHTHTPFSIVH